MSYEALYRRWRPKDFETLVGQETVKQALTNALETGHIAHAYLFAGPRGTGKTSTARILAKALNCEKGTTAHPCGECQNCLSIADGSSMDVLEIDAASNRGIDNIKELRDRIAFAPVDGRYKVFVIDEVHMLTTEAFNALLKTLEEPPENVVFILATTDPHKVPATIHSRCQRFDFHRVTVDEIVKHLVMVAKNSDIVADEEALRLIAIQAEGGMRDALSLLDQCAVISPRVTVDSVRDTLGIVGREALRSLVGAIGNYDGAKTIAVAHELLAQGREASRILTELTEYLRALLLFQTLPTYEEIYLVDDKEHLQENAKLFDATRILAATEHIAKGMNNVKFSFRPRIFMELALLHLCEKENNVVVNNSAQTASTQVPPVVAEPVAKVVPPVQEKKIVPEPVAEKQEPKIMPQPQQEVQTQKQVAPQFAEPVAPQNSQEINSLQQYWNDAVNYLAQNGKRSISSCAKMGQIIGLQDNILTVQMMNEFMVTNMERDEFKNAVEAAILAIHRLPVKCKFVAKKNLPNKNNISQEQPEMVKTALDVFGGVAKKEE